jgi:hypothetical protein
MKHKKSEMAQPAGKQTNKDVNDSMVLVGSKNICKGGIKKKVTGKKLGIGNLNIHNLKKNKLAIAFNNLENDKNSEDKNSDK